MKKVRIYLQSGQSFLLVAREITVKWVGNDLSELSWNGAKQYSTPAHLDFSRVEAVVWER